jgi:hypothetical protein
LIRNFPSKIFLLAMLLVVLFEEDGAAGIADESSRSRKANIAGSVLNVYKAPQERGITCHEASVGVGKLRVNSTNVIMRKILWKIL